MEDVLSKIESRKGDSFKEGEVVHTFGSIGTLSINGLNVPHVEPHEISDNKKIKVVLFKEQYVFHSKRKRPPAGSLFHPFYFFSQQLAHCPL